MNRLPAVLAITMALAACAAPRSAWEARHDRGLAIGQTPVDTAPDLATRDAALAAIMNRVEASAILPAGAHPLSGYARFYAWSDERRTVRATFVGNEITGRKWVQYSELPVLNDGGCSVVNIVYDVAKGEVTKLWCNGSA